MCFQIGNGGVDQADGAIADLNSLFYRSADTRRLHFELARDLFDPVRIGGRNQNPRWAFVEEQDLGTEVRIEVDACTDTARSETRFGDSHSESAVAQVMRGFGQTQAYNAAD